MILHGIHLILLLDSELFIDEVGQDDIHAQRDHLYGLHVVFEAVYQLFELIFPFVQHLQLVAKARLDLSQGQWLARCYELPMSLNFKTLYTSKPHT